MIKLAAVASVFMALSVPVSVNASAQTVNVRQGICQTIEVINPDGSGDSVRTCHTYSDGSK